MKNIARKSAALLVAAGLITAGVITTPAHSAATCSTPSGVETVAGKLTNGAAYVMKVPAKFGGTFFFWNHGFRPSFPYPGYTPPAGVEEITPYSQNRGADVTCQMLRAGFAVASFDRVTTGLHGWNTDAGVAMLKELIDLAKAKYKTTKHVVVYGSSGGAPVVNKFMEKYPGVADSAGLMAGLTNINANIQSACNLFYLLSIFADPTIKGCAAFGGKGVAGHIAALQELGKAAAVLTAWSQNLGAPGLEYPAALKGSGIPQRSALLLTGLLVGVPTKSAHMDGISTSAVIPEQSINATVAILENMGEALGTGTFAGQALAEVVGAGFYDNTKTDFSALLSEADAGRFNLGLSGDDAINAMLGVLALAPRVKGDATAMAKSAAFDAINYSSTKPTILLSNEADRLVFAGNSQLYVDNARAAYEARLATWQAKYDAARTSTAKEALIPSKPRWNTLALYALTPETYTKFTAAGLPDLAGAPAVSGVGHQSFTEKQMMTWVRMLATAADTGRVPTWTGAASQLARVPNMNTDEFYQPSLLKYNK